MKMNSCSQNGKFQPVILCIIITGFILRLGYVLYVEKTGEYPVGEGRFFIELAHNLALGKGFMLSRQFFQIDGNFPDWKKKIFEEFQQYGYMGIVQPDTPTSFVEPVIPLLYAALFTIFGENTLAPRIFQVCLSTLLIFFIFLCTLFISNSRTACIAGAISAIYPPFIYFTAGLVTQFIFTFLFFLLLWLWIRFDSRQTAAASIAIGIVSGLTLLTRADILLFLPFLFLITALKSQKKLLLVWIPVFLLSPYCHGYCEIIRSPANFSWSRQKGEETSGNPIIISSASSLKEVNIRKNNNSMNLSAIMDLKI